MQTPSPRVQEQLAQVRIVLVRPVGPRNLGAIARVMKNMGLRQVGLGGSPLRSP
jgi:tRNA C32,U32 (ribose-2'-O)-methylase TrmJ